MKTIKKIEKRAPLPTGNAAEDIRRQSEYLDYLREQLNYIFSLIQKQMNEGE